MGYRTTRRQIKRASLADKGGAHDTTIIKLRAEIERLRAEVARLKEIEVKYDQFISGAFI